MVQVRDEIKVVDSWCDGSTRVCPATVNWSRDANVDWFARTATMNLRLGTERGQYTNRNARAALNPPSRQHARFPVIGFFFFPHLFVSDPPAGRPPRLDHAYTTVLCKRRRPPPRPRPRPPAPPLPWSSLAVGGGRATLRAFGHIYWSRYPPHSAADSAWSRRSFTYVRTVYD